MEKLQRFIEEVYINGWVDKLFKIGPLKLLIDDSLGERTAALVELYSDDPNTAGITTVTQGELDAIVEAHKNNYQIAIHEIGDKSMYMDFESIEKALDKMNRKDHRHVIVHCQITDEYLLNKFEELKAVTYIQPIFLEYD